MKKLLLKALLFSSFFLLGNILQLFTAEKAILLLKLILSAIAVIAMNKALKTTLTSKQV